MTTKHIFQLGFSIVLVAVLALAGSTSLSAKAAPAGCPAIDCPSDMTGYWQTGMCQFVGNHGCVYECKVFTNGWSRCKKSCFAL